MQQFSLPYPQVSIAASRCLLVSVRRAAVWATDRPAARSLGRCNAQGYNHTNVEIFGRAQYLIRAASGENQGSSNSRCSVCAAVSPCLLQHRQPACATTTACAWEVCQHRAPGRAALEATPFAGKPRRCCLVLGPPGSLQAVPVQPYWWQHRSAQHRPLIHKQQCLTVLTLCFKPAADQHALTPAVWWCVPAALLLLCWLQGVFAPNERLLHAVRLFEGQVQGPGEQPCQHSRRAGARAAGPPQGVENQQLLCWSYCSHCAATVCQSTGRTVSHTQWCRSSSTSRCSRHEAVAPLPAATRVLAQQ